MDIQEKIDRFLAGQPFAVVGASTDRSKYGNKVLRCYLQKGLSVYPVNPTASVIEEQSAYADLTKLPEPVHGISIITPPAVSESMIDQAIQQGIRNIWLQPGAEHPGAIARAESAGLNVVANGPCILVVLGYRESSD